MKQIRRRAHCWDIAQNRCACPLPASWPTVCCSCLCVWNIWMMLRWGGWVQAVFPSMGAL